MYLDKETAIELAAKSRAVIAKLVEWKPDEPGMGQEIEDINIAIVSLEYELEKLDKAIENSPTK